MPIASKKVQVIKVPHEKQNTNTDVIQPHFERMPRMYLELLENKDKIKPNLVNKEYDPEEASSVYSFDTSHPPPKPSFEAQHDTIQEEMDETDVSEKSNDLSDDEKTSTSVSDTVSESSSVSHHDDNEVDVSETSMTVESKQTHVSSSSSQSSSQTATSTRSGSVLTAKEEDIKNNTKKKLQNLLFSDENAIPSLAELKRRGEVKDTRTIPDIGRRFHDAHTEEEDELKRELLFKFEVLKKSYKTVEIPEFTMHSDYRQMNQTYENTLRQVSLDSNVEGYKSLLVGGFMLLEFILGHWCKFDMSGFTQQQILNMNQYDRLLIELGEKSYTPGGSQWPVELRLLGLIVMNAVIFIISKLIMKSTGNNLVGLMNSVNTTMNHSVKKPKRKMRGPSVDIDAIPEVEEDVAS
jgi:hypothetical protein